jgi:hypothetical protein
MTVPMRDASATAGKPNLFKERIMNRHVAIALACTLATAAFAGDITVDPNPFVSTASRAQVREELAGFRQAGVNPWADDYNQLAHYGGTLTRSQVKAGFIGARNEVAAFSGEDSGSMYLARSHAPARQRANEMARAE